MNSHGARVVAFVPDLLFGSQVLGSLRAAGHEVRLVSDESGVCAALAEGAGVLVVDLTDDAPRRAGLLASLAREDLLADVRTLAFYSHIDVSTRALAEDAGFDLVVPRSRMARAGGELVTRLAGGARKAG